MIAQLLPTAVREMLPGDSAEGPPLTRSVAACLSLQQVNGNAIALLLLFLAGLMIGPWLALHYPGLDMVAQTDFASRFIPGVRAPVVTTLLAIAALGILCSIILMALIQVSPWIAYLATAGLSPFFGAEYALFAMMLPVLLTALKLGVSACIAMLLYQSKYKILAIISFLLALLLFATDGSLISADSLKPFATIFMGGIFIPGVILSCCMFTIESVRAHATTDRKSVV